MRHYRSVLVANRGEIACRVIRAARSLGYRTVAIYSDADADALHVRSADLAVRVGPPPVRDSYLSIPAILDAMRRSGADAVHPGYGFLSENDAFARACEDAGFVFIGPPSSAIRAMGNKAAAKRWMIEANVPTIPGWHGEAQDEASIARAAADVGYPLLIKAAAGGGGRGMRVVRSHDALLPSIRTARAEAESAFGSGELLLERALLDARHVEIQVLADVHGHVIHLGERDCSIQRRHQKIIEESPSPVVDARLRDAMGAAAIAAARSIGYVGAGTVEFLLDADGSFYFLEMNTRLQVEHPVTELVTGLDLVAWQLRIAAGERLSIAQSDVAMNGHAIEARLYAEDPYEGFLPQTGRVCRWLPGVEGSDEGRVTDGRRIDHGLVEGQEISPWYDPMLAKLVAWGRDREEARRRLARLLADTAVLGVTTNKTFLGDVLAHSAFVEGKATTAFIAHHVVPSGAESPARGETPPWLRAAGAVLLSLRGDTHSVAMTGESTWTLRVREGRETSDVRVRLLKGDRFEVAWGAERVDLVLVRRTAHDARVAVDGVQYPLRYARDEAKLFVDTGPATCTFEELPLFTNETHAASSDGRVLAPMNGRIVSVHVATDDVVQKGTLVAVLEAMKMQHQLLCDVTGKVAEVPVTAGDQVSTRALIARITPDA